MGTAIQKIEPLKISVVDKDTETTVAQIRIEPQKLIVTKDHEDCIKTGSVVLGYSKFVNFQFVASRRHGDPLVEAFDSEEQAVRYLLVLHLFDRVREAMFDTQSTHTHIKVGFQ